MKRLGNTGKLARRVTVLVRVLLEGGGGRLGLDDRVARSGGGGGGGGGDLEGLGEGLASGIDRLGGRNEEGDLAANPVLRGD